MTETTASSRVDGALYLALAAKGSDAGSERESTAFWLGAGFVWMMVGPLVGFLIGRLS